MTTSTAADPPVFDLAQASDHGRWTGAQKLVLLLVSCAIVFDGFDNQAIGLAAPAIIREWHITKSALAPIIAIGHVGMLFGAAIAGFAGDRFGRKAALSASVLLFAVATLAMGLVPDAGTLGLLRVIAGLGLGGAIPNAVALVAEFTPVRFRQFAVSACIVCVPMGGVVGGLIGAQLLPVAGWRALFAFAGVATALIGFGLLALLPESPRFLLQRSGDTPRLRRILQRVGIAVPADARLAAPSQSPAQEKSSLALLGRDYRWDSIALWIAFGFSLLGSYACFAWLPALLTDAGFSLSLSSTGLMAFNLGGVAAALVSATIIGRFGSRGPMGLMAAGCVVTALLLMAVPLDPARPVVVMIAWLAVLGAFVTAVQVALYALAAHVYPVAIKSRGVGAAASVGRIGAIGSAYLGVVMDKLGANGFYITLAVTMGVAGVTLLAVRRHAKPNR